MKKFMKKIVLVVLTLLITFNQVTVFASTNHSNTIENEINYINYQNSQVDYVENLEIYAKNEHGTYRSSTVVTLAVWASGVLIGHIMTQVVDGVIVGITGNDIKDLTAQQTRGLINYLKGKRVNNYRRGVKLVCDGHPAWGSCRYEPV